MKVIRCYHTDHVRLICGLFGVLKVGEPPWHSVTGLYTIMLQFFFNEVVTESEQYPVSSFRWTPQALIMAEKGYGYGDYGRVLLKSYYTTIAA